MTRKGIAAFTLVELLVTMVIVGLLGALTIPTFRQHMIKGRRVEGQAALLQLMQQQERYYSQNNRYLAFSSASTDAQEQRFKWWSGETAAVSAYEIKGVACPEQSINQCVLLSATPGTARVDERFQDRDCETLYLNSSGYKNASGKALRCWP